MAERDLITEGRAALKANATFGVVKLGQWARANLGTLLDALEAKHTQHAETLGLLEHAYELIEVEKRPPLGYAAIARTSVTDRLLAYSRIHSTVDSVREWGRGKEIIVAELREVRS